jgi:hypothetical protein
MNKKILLAVVAVIAIVAFLLLIRMRPVIVRVPGKSMDAKSVEQAVRAAAILENNMFDEAIDLYEKIIENNPSNSIAKKNLAVAMVGKVKQEIKFLADGTKDRAKIRSGLNAVLDKARLCIDRAMASRIDDPACYQLDVELDLARISLLDALMAEDDQIALVEKLKGYVKKFPGDAFMVTRLENAVDTIRNTEPKYLDDLAEPLLLACKAHPRNLFMLTVLLGHLAIRNDERVFEHTETFAKLLQPFRWNIKATNPANDFNELLAVNELRKTDPELAFRTIVSWTYISKGTTGSQADLRLSLPNTLALIDLSDVESALETLPKPAGSVEMSFEMQTLNDVPATGAIAFDWNVDTVREVVSWQGTSLALSRINKGGQAAQSTKGEFGDGAYQLESLLGLELPGGIRGVVPADLFEVKSGTRSKPVSSTGTDIVKKSAAELQEALKANRRHDTLRDLLVFGDFGVALVVFETPPTPDSPPKWSIVSKEFGLSDLKEVKCVLPVDWDADSDLDLVCISNGNKISLKQNRGNRTFENVNSESILPGDDFQILTGVVVDFDRDVDLDVLVSCKDKVGVLENILHGQFRFRELDGKWSALANAQSMAAGELDGNYSWDYVALTDKDLVVMTTTTIPAQAVAPLLINKQPLSASWMTLEDWNNDGLLDVMVASQAEGLMVFANNQGRLEKKVLIPGSEGAVTKPSMFDCNQDGFMDCLSVSKGKIVLALNKLAGSANYADIRVQGGSDDSGGGRINHFSVGSVVEVFSPVGYQARLIEDDSVHFGFRDASPYNLRIVFPNGLTQNVVDPPKNQLIEEVQIPKGSCPFLYGWDGEQWSLVTDLLWNAPLGLQIAKGKPLPDRRWEHLLISGKAIKPKDGFIELRVTEELWEAAYFDHIALAYVDHASDVEVHSNEKVGPPTIAQPGLWVANDPLPLKNAKDKVGKDWTQVLSQRDSEFAIPFEKRICQGYVEEHWIEFDFGSIDTSRSSQLYLTGWIYPTDTSINLGLDQNPDLDGPVPPSLWTVDANGAFRNAIPFTGFPGGKPKTIVIPLDGIFTTEDHRIRIQHSSEIYWDRAMVAYGEFKSLESMTMTTKLEMHSADLQYRGFSHERLSGRSQPHWYDYNQSKAEPNWPPMSGLFTRYGDVSNILARDDDYLVVMGAGDEIKLRFALPTQQVKEGWTRDWIMHNVGWDKDADLNTLEGQSSMPLPFSKMTNYPPPMNQAEEALRVDRLHRETLIRQQNANHFWRAHRN